jgi:hypothetical protein
VMCVCCNSHPLALLCGISGHSLDNHWSIHTAGIFSIAGSPPAFHVLNGVPGYINLMDALNAYQLVTEAQ